MANTTNFGWETPDDTDLVKDGASAIRTLGSSIDTSFVDLKGGTTGQVLAKASNTDLDFTWSAADPLSILDAKGDLISATAADTPARLASSGINGQVLTIDTTTSTGLKWASAGGGINWTQRKAPHGQALRTIAYNGSNLYVAAGASGELFTSSDAITWTSRTSGFGAQSINKVFFGNGLWVAVGTNGTITTSSDGTTWTARTSNMSTNELYDVIYANGNWVVVGDGGGGTNTGGIAYSSDGLTWTRKSQTPSIGTTYYAITWNGTNYVVGATLATNNFLYASNPAGTWTAGNEANLNQAIEWLAYDGARTIGLSGARYFYSTSATLASSEAYNAEIANESTAAVQRQSISYYNGQVVAAALYYMVFTTAPTATTYPTTLNPLTLSPGAIRTSSTPFIANRTSSVFSGAVGVIVATNSGRIFTSF